jgi:hypothetical protein
MHDTRYACILSSTAHTEVEHSTQQRTACVVPSTAQGMHCPQHITWLASPPAHHKACSAPSTAQGLLASPPAHHTACSAPSTAHGLHRHQHSTRLASPPAQQTACSAPTAQHTARIAPSTSHGLPTQSVAPHNSQSIASILVHAGRWQVRRQAVHITNQQNQHVASTQVHPEDARVHPVRLLSQFQPCCARCMQVTCMPSS